MDIITTIAYFFLWGVAKLWLNVIPFILSSFILFFIFFLYIFLFSISSFFLFHTFTKKKKKKRFYFYFNQASSLPVL